MALRIIATFHVRCIKNGIEVYPFYLRSLRNIRPDFITREDDRNIQLWATEEGFSRIEKPWWWEQFLACAPKLDWVEDRIVNLPRLLKIGTMDGLGRVGEWNPKSGICLQIIDNLGLDYHAIGGSGLFQDYRITECNKWKLIFGSARHRGEIDEFRELLERTEVKIAILITPSEVEEEIWYPTGFWTQSWQCGSAKYGDMMAGAWNVYVRSPSNYASLELNAPGRMLGSIRRAFADNGLFFLDNPAGVTSIRPIENSIGKTIVVRRVNGEERLSPDSQIPPYSRKEAVMENYDWPVLNQAYRSPKIREKLLVLGHTTHGSPPS